MELREAPVLLVVGEGGEVSVSILVKGELVMHNSLHQTQVARRVVRLCLLATVRSECLRALGDVDEDGALALGAESLVVVQVGVAGQHLDGLLRKLVLVVDHDAVVEGLFLQELVEVGHEPRLGGAQLSSLVVLREVEHWRRTLLGQLLVAQQVPVEVRHLHEAPVHPLPHQLSQQHPHHLAVLLSFSLLLHRPYPLPHIRLLHVRPHAPHRLLFLFLLLFLGLLLPEVQTLYLALYLLTRLYLSSDFLHYFLASLEHRKIGCSLLQQVEGPTQGKNVLSHQDVVKELVLLCMRSDLAEDRL